MSSLEKLQPIFLQALTETFENLFFEDVLLHGSSWVYSDSDFPESWWVRIDVLEPFKSCLILVVRKDLMVRYTEAIFGMIEDQMPEESQVLDNLGELMNTMCGRIMALLLPENCTFKLGLPVVGEGKIQDLTDKYISLNCLIGDNLVFLLLPESFCFSEFAPK
ncbi:MAG: chemotaxis protein CheX [Candidatus Riflebacteria bacterium]